MAVGSRVTQKCCYVLGLRHKMTKLLYPDIYFTLFLLYPVEDLAQLMYPLSIGHRGIFQKYCEFVITSMFVKTCLENIQVWCIYN